MTEIERIEKIEELKARLKVIDELEIKLKAIRNKISTIANIKNDLSTEKKATFQELFESKKTEKKAIENLLATEEYNEYNIHADIFLLEKKATLKIEFLKNGIHFLNDEYNQVKRDIYKITIKRNNKKYSFNFGNSVFNSEQNIKPSNYDILSTLEKVDYGTLQEFCDNIGYDIEDKNTKILYQACKKQYDNIITLFPDCIEELQNIY